jgi:hypothetical protein
MIPAAFVERIEPEPNSGCWLWVGGLTRNGYGSFCLYDAGRQTTSRAHRFAYELLVGPIPDGLQLDHLCRVRSCVNSRHMEPVTSRENSLRGVGLAAQNIVKTHCPRGHQYDMELKGRRWCSVCRRAGRNIYRKPKASL